VSGTRARLGDVLPVLCGEMLACRGAGLGALVPDGDEAQETLRINRERLAHALDPVLVQRRRRDEARALRSAVDALRGR
jgi:hypothetical protein